MGVRHSIELYFLQKHFEAAVYELMAIVDKRHTRPFNIQWPNGTKMEVFAHPSLPPKLDRTFPGYESVLFDTILLFPVDEVIQDYIDSFDLETKKAIQAGLLIQNENRYFSLGHLNVLLASGLEYSRLTLSPVTSSHNRMMRESASIHGTLMNILKAENGVAGFVDLESGDYLLLSDLSRRLHIDVHAFRDGMDVDAMTKDLMVRLASS